jgi:hypothetical protein
MALADGPEELYCIRSVIGVVHGTALDYAPGISARATAYFVKRSFFTSAARASGFFELL